MTLAVQSWRVLYNANGSQTSFSIPQSFFSDTSIIVVKVRNPLVDPPTVATKTGGGTDYTITGTNVVFVTAPTSGYVVGIFRVLDIKQDIDFDSNAVFPVETLETRLDKHAAIMQQLQGGIDRALKVPDTAASGQLNFEIKKDFVANACLIVNSDATGMTMGPDATDIAADAAEAAASATSAAGSATASASSATSASASATAAAASATAAAASAAIASGSNGYNVNSSYASPQLVAASGTVSFTAGYRRSKVYIEGSGGAQTAIQIQAGANDGDELLLVGCDNTNLVTMDVAGRILTKGTRVLGSNDVIKFNWDSGQSLWIEEYRNA